MKKNRLLRSVPLWLGVVAALAGCASGMARREQAPPDRYVEYAGEPIKEFFAWRIDGWSPVSRDQLVVWTGVNEAFLLRVWDTCPNLEFATTVGISQLMRSISTFDKVKVGRETCPIREIRKIDVKRMKAAEKADRDQAVREKSVEKTP